jgi:elongation factor P hydroxylase
LATNVRLNALHYLCNGPHDGFNDSFDPDHPHWDYHVHRASAEMIEAGLRPERAATINREEAAQYFLRAPNITDARTYFADPAQGMLPFSTEEPTQ